MTGIVPPGFASSAEAHSELANVLDHRGDWRGALDQLRLAHAATPQVPQARLNLALALLRIGDYREGLPLYEARIDKPAWSGFATIDSRAAARQLLLRPGDSVEGRRIVVLAEQGLGDCIMFARYIPMLAQRGARIALACNPTLRPFFARIPGIQTLLAPPADQPFAQINLAMLPFDGWVPLLSLPYFFGTDLASIPAEIPYWRPDESRVAAWRDRLNESGRRGVPKVGLVFQANPAAANHGDRSMTVSDLMPLLARQEIDFVNLQHGPAGRELASAAPAIIDPLAAEVPLDEFGAVLAATDLLITVDTMAVHLAGAMGHPLWLAAPFSAQWFWGLDQVTTPWYPTARIFRQHAPRDWSALAGHLNGALLSTDIAIPARARFAAPVRTPRDHAADDLIGSDAARLELGIAQLRRGEFEAGFANYEARIGVSTWSEQVLPLRESLAAVRERRLRPGDSVRGRHILVFTEQGLGDTFFGARFLAPLAERGATITMICGPAMYPFFARLPFLDAILSPPKETPHARVDLRRLSFDAFCPLLSLPHVLGVARELPLPGAPYLSADPLQVAAWRARYARQGRPGHRKVGLVWQDNPVDAALSPNLMRAQEFAALGQLEGIDLVNLQQGPVGRELAHIAPQAIDPVQTPLALDEFAAALAATDLVVSADTMAAHCAGALGKEVYVMLSERPAWYWGAEPNACAWYPSARLFRRGVGPDWSKALEAVIKAVQGE